MSNIKSNNQKLNEYRANVDSALSMSNFKMARTWNDIYYDLTFSLYSLAQSRFFKNECLIKLEKAAELGVEIQRGLLEEVD